MKTRIRITPAQGNYTELVGDGLADLGLAAQLELAELDAAEVRRLHALLERHAVPDGAVVRIRPDGENGCRFSVNERDPDRADELVASVKGDGKNGGK